jgi:hypothetical protein
MAGRGSDRPGPSSTTERSDADPAAMRVRPPPSGRSKDRGCRPRARHATDRLAATRVELPGYDTRPQNHGPMFASASPLVVDTPVGLDVVLLVGVAHSCAVTLRC